jgi:general secretion pathway protein L
MAKRTGDSYLQIHLGERWPESDRVRWSRRAGNRVDEGACAVREIPPADEITVVVPASRVAFARASLPRGPLAKLARLAPFAIEDAIAPSPDRVRTALVRDLGDGQWVVAVIDREWLERVLAELAAEGAGPDRIVAECALVPCEPGSWTVVWHGSGGFVVIDGGEAIALDASLDGRPPLALKLAADECRGRADAPRAVRVLAAGAAELPDLGKWSESLHVPVSAGGRWRPETVDARRVATADLLAETAAPGWHDSGWVARLKPAALIAAIVLGVHTLLTVGDWVRLRYEAAALRTEAESQFRKAFPDAKAVVDPALQMGRGVAGLRRAAGEPDATDAIPLLARIAPALRDANLRAQAIKYERGQMELELAVPAGESREALAARLRSPGIVVRVERVASTVGGTTATVRVTAEGG